MSKAVPKLSGLLFFCGLGINNCQVIVVIPAQAGLPAGRQESKFSETQRLQNQPQKAQKSQKIRILPPGKLKAREKAEMGFSPH